MNYELREEGLRFWRDWSCGLTVVYEGEVDILIIKDAWGKTIKGHICLMKLNFPVQIKSLCIIL